jgi:hypothetical protein
MNDEETLSGDAITSQARKEAERSSCEMAVLLAGCSVMK